MYNRLWTCKDGRKMSVSDMDNTHLANSIAKIERSITWRRDWLSRLYIEKYARQAGLSTKR